MNNRTSCTLAGALCFLLCAFCSWPLVPSRASAELKQTAAENPEYILGVYPALPVSQLDKLFSPIAQELSRGLHRAILFQSSSTYEKYSSRLDRGDFDIALVHPFDYVLHAEKAGYVPVVRKNEELSAVFVVPVDSPIKTLMDLKGKTIAMSPEGSAVGSLAIAELTRLGLLRNNAVQLKYFGEHDSSLQNVVIRNTEAAATCRAIMRIYETTLGTRLRIIGETASVPHSLFVVHKRVPKEERALIKKILLNTTLSGVPENLRKAFVIEGKAPFVAVSRKDMERLKKNPAILEGNP